MQSPVLETFLVGVAFGIGITVLSLYAQKPDPKTWGQIFGKESLRSGLQYCNSSRAQLVGKKKKRAVLEFMKFFPNTSLIFSRVIS